MKKKIAFNTLGCKLNLNETDSLVSDFHKSGYDIVSSNEQADVYIINTCTVTNKSDRKSRNIINRARNKINNPVVLVTGCFAENSKEYLERFDDITYVIDNKRKSQIFSIIDAHFNGEILKPDELKSGVFDFSTAETSLHTRSMIKIQDGCDKFCSYCIIPYVRGRAQSRPYKDILKNIKSILTCEYKEIVLTGINMGSYNYEGTNFSTLLEMILELDGDFRVRISSLEPEGIDPLFISLMSHPKMCRNLHICLQSGSDRILKLMNRDYTIDNFKTSIQKIKKVCSNFNFTTDIIVGFPGETDDDFKKSCEMLIETGFSHVHTFPYSVRTGTKAAKIDNHINSKLKAERAVIIRGLSEVNKKKYRESFIGKKQRVLIEKIVQNQAEGFGEHYIPVKFSGTGLIPNSFCEILITGIEDGNNPVLLAEPVIRYNNL
ncbi:MAG: tRNA (N(6)-L-threonylcarbamoyladenosine(37)-C(2))-methylthiotransferase MtaB [Spirochaetes bacterium]|nr:tRNA (N(6)-L-threonylcarbamoyladenosine(37)-C(2))-methylthiotransferase MtaB [Spirochaetota bacterium]